jgi:DNA replication protein DnaC
MLHGCSGSGKSLGAGLAIATADGGRWTSSLRVLAAYSSWYGEAAAAQTRFEACALLVIDDLGREPLQQAPRMATALLELIDARQRRRTIITTRMLPTELETRYDLAALKSRIAAIGTHVVLPEEDLRPVLVDGKDGAP